MDVIVSQSSNSNGNSDKKKKKSFSCGSLFAITIKADNTTVTTITIPKRNVILTLTTACTNKPLPARLYVSPTTTGGDFLCIGSLHDQKPMIQMGIQFTDSSIQLKAESIKSSSIDSTNLSINIFGTIQPISSPSSTNNVTNNTQTKVPTPISNNNNTNNDVDNGTLKKRKLNQVNENEKQSEKNENDDDDDLKKKLSIDNNNGNNNGNNNDNDEPPLKLTKKERKRLAKQKNMELQQVMLQNQQKKQGTNDNNKKEEELVTNKKGKKETTKVTSITQQRRLEGGLLVRDIIIGSGTVAKSGKKVCIHYEGKLTDTDQVFDRNQSRSNPLSFRVGTGQVIKGLERGMEGMRVGGERVLTIPPSLAYGAKGSGNVIPKNASLTFTVKLISIGGR